MTAHHNNLEIEVKLAGENLDGFRHAGFALHLVEARHFEDNRLLDAEDRGLFQQGAALRVRSVNGKGVLTYKGVAQDSATAILKVREELESPVDDPERVLAILARLGFRQSFRYQKYRTVYHLTHNNRAITVTFDETPIGNFIEIEGDEVGVLDTMQAAGFSATDIIRESYPELQAKRCKERGLPIEDLLFSP
ncbi:MAG: class IV adenylate cyclase [Acidobacteria bacterium]|nr:class IV adenylate cyclase [Acidobacteriota bacterium]